MPALWNSFSACLGGRNARITVKCLNLIHQGGVIPLELHALCAPSSVIRHLPSVVRRLSSVICLLSSALCRMKLVLRLDVGLWSGILRVWEIVKNRGFDP